MAPLPTAYVKSGVLRIQRDVTTYRKNAYGVADNSYLDSETLHTSAYVLRKLKSVITSKYGRHKLASDGTPDLGKDEQGGPSLPELTVRTRNFGLMGSRQFWTFFRK